MVLERGAGVQREHEREQRGARHVHRLRAGLDPFARRAPTGRAARTRPNTMFSMPSRSWVGDGRGHRPSPTAAGSASARRAARWLAAAARACQRGVAGGSAGGARFASRQPIRISASAKMTKPQLLCSWMRRNRSIRSGVKFAVQTPRPSWNRISAGHGPVDARARPSPSSQRCCAPASASRSGAHGRGVITRRMRTLQLRRPPPAVRRSSRTRCGRSRPSMSNPASKRSGASSAGP